MVEQLHHVLTSLWSLPHLRAWLTLGWALYLVGLGVWIVLQKREPVATLSWLVSLAALPYLGFVIYYVFGPQRLVRHRARRDQRRGAIFKRLAAADPSARELYKLALRSTGNPPTTACAVRLLIDGSQTYPALLSAIAMARHHVHLEYYIFEPDSAGRAVLQALVERARTGVQVRLLVDAIGSARLRRHHVAELIAAGGEVVWFHPPRLWLPWRRPWVNLRTHRKLVILDGNVGFIGGINITESEDDRLRSDAYRDLHLQVQGDLVRSFQDVFLEDWVYASGQAAFVPLLADAMPTACPGTIHAQLLSSGPDSTWEAIHRMHVSLIHHASRRVWLSTPYFVPGEAARMALTSAALGGLDVRLLVPAVSDSRLVTYCTRSFYDELLQAGVRIYEYGPRMLHTKALLIDDQLALIGSANFDHRSFRLNFEASLLLDDAGTAAQLQQYFETEWAQARRVPNARKTSLLQDRLPEAFARLLSPLL